MARRNASQGTPATAALAAAGVPFVLHPYTHDPSAASYGAEAAEALGIDPLRVFKTLMVEVEGRLAVGIVPVSGTLDLKAFATKEDLKAYATKEDLREESERTRRELRMLTEHHDDQIRVIAEGHVWLAERLEACRRHREDAQRVLDARVTRLESRQ